jgi:hypothetical protein
MRACSTRRTALRYAPMFRGPPAWAWTAIRPCTRSCFAWATDERDRLVSKPAVGKSGNGVLFGSQTSEQDWLAAAVHAARESPVVLQRRVESDRITMPFLDRDSGQEIVAQVPLVLSPFMIDGGAASVGVRHMGPGVGAGDVVIGASRGGFQSTALLTPDPV